MALPNIPTTSNDWKERDDLVRRWVDAVPKSFGLRKFPRGSFVVDPAESFYSPGVGVMLYIYLFRDDCSTMAFAKTTPEELYREMIPEGRS